MLVVLVLFFLFPKIALNVKVSGNVEFGPEWLLEANDPTDDNTDISQRIERLHFVNPVFAQLTTEKQSHKTKKRKVTKDKVSSKSKDSNKTNKDTIERFSHLVYDQTVKTFNKLVKAVKNQQLRKETELAKDIYKDQFRNYLKAVKDLKSRSVDSTKIILTTVDTSSKIVRKLVEDIKKYSKKQQDNEGLSSAITNKDVAMIEELMENEVESEYVIACQEFNACRSDPEPGESFLQFAINCMSKALTVNEINLRNAHYTVINVVKRTDFTNIVDEELDALIHLQNEFISQWQTGDIRPGYVLFLQRLKSGERPMVFFDDESESQPVAVLSLIDRVNPRIPATNETFEEWRDMKIIVAEWAEGQRSDIKDIVKMVVHHVLERTGNETIQVLGDTAVSPPS